jgi:hypothetical protein
VAPRKIQSAPEYRRQLLRPPYTRSSENSPSTHSGEQCCVSSNSLTVRLRFPLITVAVILSQRPYVATGGGGSAGGGAGVSSTRLVLLAARRLRSLTSQLLIDALLVEAHDPAAPDLDNRHARLSRLAHDVAGCLLIAFYVDLLERNSLFFEILVRCPHRGAPGDGWAHEERRSLPYRALRGRRSSTT